jgi:peptidoglycan/xylan/chitin deacetylase (PgdA/CDA1 family)
MVLCGRIVRPERELSGVAHLLSAGESTMMQAGWSALRARVGNRLSRHFAIAPHRLTDTGPMVSFTFDDVPKSAATAGASILEEYNGRGTFYVAGAMVDQRDKHWDGVSAAEIVDLHRRGHEVACHTYSHSRAIDLDTHAMSVEMERNRRYFSALDPSIRLENFAYPYGQGSLLRKRQLARSFRSSRGILPGVNSGTVDLHYLRAFPLIECEISRDGVDRAFNEAVEKSGWLIFYSHDVEAAPSPYGCSPALLRHALGAAARRDIPIVSIAEALRRAGA